MLLTSRLLVGLLLLFLGRRLYWLFVAGVGFLCGLAIAPRLLPQGPELAIVLAAAVLALIGALLAVVAAKVALGLIGFAAGAGTAALLLSQLSSEQGLLALVVCAIAGIIGAVLLVALFDWALIALSSIAGAGLIATGVDQLWAMTSTGRAALIIALSAIGILVQSRLWPTRRNTR